MKSLRGRQNVYVDVGKLKIEENKKKQKLMCEKVLFYRELRVHKLAPAPL